MRDVSRLESDKIGSLLLRFTVPAMISLLFHALYNVVDRIFIGQVVGPLGLAAVSVSFPIMMIQFSAPILLGTGACASASILLGEKRRGRAERVLGNLLTLLLAVSLVLTVAGLLLLEPLLLRVGANRQILPYATTYLRIILIGTVFPTFGFGLNNMIRGEGNPRTAMEMIIAGTVLNLILDAVFILALGWGIAGAALATVCAQFLSAAWGLSYYLFGTSHLKIRTAFMRLDPAVVGRILSIGFPPFIIHLSVTLRMIIFNRQLEHYGGEIAVAALGIIFAVFTFIIMPIFAIADGMQPIAGYNVGARRIDRAHRTLLLSCGAATAVTFLAFLVMQLFPGPIVRLFSGGDPALTAATVRGLRIVVLLAPVIGVQIVGSRYFQAVGKAFLATLLGVTRQLILVIPLALVLPLWFGVDGIWAAAPISDGLSVLITLVFLGRELRRPTVSTASPSGITSASP